MPRLSELLHGDFFEKPTDEIIQRKALSRIAPDYAMLFFDHLHSEYLALKSGISDPSVIQLLDDLHEKRLGCELTWSDIYSFDLSLVQARPLENLIRKAYDARAKYRSIAGQKEYDEYVASKPPNLPEIQIDPDANPPLPKIIIERALRADLEYLLSKVYLYYAILPVRERLRDWLTNRAVLITIISVAVLMLGILFNVAVGLRFIFHEYTAVSVPFVTLLTVVSAGIIGGCVSMLQRIQSAPTEGDALFNLAALNSGWKGIFLSPLYGGIFAALLFVLFAAGLLEGSAFPRISTPRRAPQATTNFPRPSASPTASPSPSASPGAIPSASPSRAATISSSPTLSASPSPSPTTNGPVNTASSGTPKVDDGIPTPGTEALAKSSPQASPTPTSTPPAEGLTRFPVLGVEDFLKHTGPSDGTSYALLIIWSFIAGFAERLVPDTLNRLVTKNEKIQGTST
ncbi:MAG TPA: hypothetical protein VNO50_21325 [Pyrinomonadaceae bacterium]|nr:hypothetical protein [Pyrinomonadaceae bacterium]